MCTVVCKVAEVGKSVGGGSGEASAAGEVEMGVALVETGSGGVGSAEGHVVGGGAEEKDRSGSWAIS